MKLETLILKLTEIAEKYGDDVDVWTLNYDPYTYTDCESPNPRYTENGVYLN